jgi:hypothetical protein
MVLAIDIGLAGAVAVIAESGELIEIHDMPTLEDGPRNRATINAPFLAAIVAKSGAPKLMSNGSVRGPQMALCRPSPSGGAKVLEGVLAASGVPVAFLTPPVWKRAHTIPPGRDQKGLARSRAIPCGRQRRPFSPSRVARRADRVDPIGMAPDPRRQRKKLGYSSIAYQIVERNVIFH